MNILLIDYRSKNQELFNSLSTYEHTLVLSKEYDEFIEHYDENEYDICVLNTDNYEEAKFVLHYMVHQNPQQNILYLYKNEEERCFFEHDCELCKEYQIQSLPYSSNTALINAIENFEQFICSNRKK